MKDRFANKPLTIHMIKSKKRSQNGVIDHIPLIDEINFTFPDGTVKPRKIRYIKGAVSIFADEQPEEYDHKWEKADMRPKTLRVFNGTLTIDPSEINLREFIKICNFNSNNPSRKPSSEKLFEIFDPERKAAEANRKRDLKIEADYTVKNMKEHELRAHIIVLSTGSTLEHYMRYRNMEVEQLRDIAYHMASQDAQKFLDTFKAPQTKNKYIVINAILRDLIRYDEQTQTLKWLNGDILQLPGNGMNAMDALAEFAITSSTHKAIIDDLYSRMADRMPSDEKKVAEPNNPGEMPKPKDLYETLIENCITAEIITNKFPWYVINNKKDDPAEKEVLKFKGKNALLEAMKNDGKKLYLDLLERLETVEV